MNNEEPILPTGIKILAVVVGAVVGALVRSLLVNQFWLLQIFAFIIAFTFVYGLVGVIYIKIKENNKGQ